MGEADMTQELKVENPLGMYDGCYAKQRNGEVLGPWKWDAAKGWWRMGEFAVRQCDGRNPFAGEADAEVDLIAVAPAPLPEPIERWAAIGPNRTWITGCDSATQARRIAGETDFKVYRVRIEFLEEVTL